MKIEIPFACELRILLGPLLNRKIYEMGASSVTMVYIYKGKELNLETEPL